MGTHEKILLSASESRGKIIQLVVEMEVWIDRYIAAHFIDTEIKQAEFSMLVLSELGLQKKSQLFFHLLNEDGDNDKNNVLILSKNIDKIIIERNIFAHYPNDFSEDASARYEEKKIVTYVRWKRGKLDGKTHLGIRHLYSQDNVNALIGLIVEVNKVLKSLVATE